MTRMKYDTRSTAAFIVTLFIIVVTMPLAWHLPRSAEATPARVPEITLETNDTTVSPFDSIYFLSVFLTTATQEVAGMQIDFSASRPDLVSLADAEYVDTIILCIDTVDCDPADTIISSGINLEGSDILGWEFLDANPLAPTFLRFVGLADNPGGGNPPPLAPSESRYFLFRIALRREMPIDILDTLCDRTVTWFVNPPFTHFADPNGNLIGDAATNVYVDGSLTIGPICLLGDVNANGSINSSDVIFLVKHVFQSGPAPACTNAKSADVDCSNFITSADVIYLVNFIFKSGPAPSCCG